MTEGKGKGKGKVYGLPWVKKGEEPWMTVGQFIDAFYKPDRLHDVEGRRERMIAYYSEEFIRNGLTGISGHDNTANPRGIYLIDPRRVADLPSWARKKYDL